jgi:hypothetical protein
MDLKQLLLVVVVFAAVVLGEKIRYDNHKVYRVSIQNEQQLKLLQDIEKKSDGVSNMGISKATVDKYLQFSTCSGNYQLKLDLRSNLWWHLRKVLNSPNCNDNIR